MLEEKVREKIKLLVNNVRSFLLFFNFFLIYSKNIFLI